MEMTVGNCVVTTEGKMDYDQTDTSIIMSRSGKKSRPCEFAEQEQIRTEGHKIEAYLTTTLKLLHEAETNCAQLQNQLCELWKESLNPELEIKSEKVQRQRLTYDNEALQWQLKQRSEQLHVIETTLHELSDKESHNTRTQSISSGCPSAMNTSLSCLQTSRLSSEIDEELAVEGRLDD